MILADKLIVLRKKNNWSQEELAEKLGVSRQSVSKWESAASIPDINKIIELAKIFDVTTDYLLKEDKEAEEYSEEDSASLYKLTLQEAEEFMTRSKEAGKKVAAGVTTCILAPIPLLILGALSEKAGSGITEDFAGGVGTSILLIIVAIAVIVFITSESGMRKFDFIEKTDFEMEYGVAGIVKERKKNYETTYNVYTAIATALCIVSAVPLILSAIFSCEDYIYVFMTALLLAIVSVAVNIFIRIGSINGSYDKLLCIGEYSPEGKQRASIISKIAGVYWPLVVAIYLGFSFYTLRWDFTWFVWPVAALIFAAITGIVKMINK